MDKGSKKSVSVSKKSVSSSKKSIQKSEKSVDSKKIVSTKRSSQKTSRVKKITEFETLRYNVAGIDVSDNGGMFVAYSISETEVALEEFDCYTRDLRCISSTLKSHNIVSVAMESTGYLFFCFCRKTDLKCI
jgi:hypothetical protein